MSGYTSLLLKTRRTTSIIAGDDGDLQRGIAPSYTVLDTGQYSGTTNIVLNGKTDTHSNNCVQDNVTGLMWSRAQSAGVGEDMGKGAVGLLPWTTNGSGEGIFTYAAAANAANLAGHNDWCVPNKTELMSIFNVETYSPDTTAWNGYIGELWTSSFFDQGTDAFLIANAYEQLTVRTYATYVLLVRGAPTAPPTGGGCLTSILSGLVG